MRVPVVTTDTLTLRAVAVPGTDVLVVESPDGWRTALSAATDDLTRRRVGAQAERRVQLRHGPMVQGRSIVDAVSAVLAAPRSTAPLPPAGGPPPARVTLAPYAPPASPEQRLGVLRRLRRRLR